MPNWEVGSGRKLRSPARGAGVHINIDANIPLDGGERPRARKTARESLIVRSSSVDDMRDP